MIAVLCFPLMLVVDAIHDDVIKQVFMIFYSIYNCHFLMLFGLLFLLHDTYRSSLLLSCIVD